MEIYYYWLYPCWLSFLSDHFWSLPCFLWSNLHGKLPLALKVLHLLDQAVTSFQSRRQNHCSLLFCKHSPILFNFSLGVSFSTEILSSGLTVNIHLTILSSFLYCLITSSSSNDQVSLPYSITLCYVEYNLLFAAKGKLQVANKGTKSLNAHHPLLIKVIALSKKWSFSCMSGLSLAMSLCWFAHVLHLNCYPL